MAVATPDIPWRPPELFAAGDSLIYNRWFSQFLPADGWSVLGTLTDEATGNLVTQYQSTPSITDTTVHAINVANFAAAFNAKDYMLTEEVVNSVSGERHQVYLGELTLQPNLAGGTASEPILTHAQKMIAALEATALQLAQEKFSETDVQRNRFVLQKQADNTTQLNIWYEKRNWEIKQERARNGLDSPDNIRPILRF